MYIVETAQDSLVCEAAFVLVCESSKVARRITGYLLHASRNRLSFTAVVMSINFDQVLGLSAWHLQACKSTNASGALLIDPDDEDGEPFGTWKWEVGKLIWIAL